MMAKAQLPEGWATPAEGATLLDQFAMHTIEGLLSSWSTTDQHNPMVTARLAWAYAEAMLATRPPPPAE